MRAIRSLLFFKKYHNNLNYLSRNFTASVIHNNQAQQKSGFLTQNYQCNSAWEKRLEAPILKNVKLEEFFFELDQRYQAEQIISAIDVDIFANRVDDPEYLDELEELVHRLRKSPAASDILPSTSHALIRAMLEKNYLEGLMRVVNDRFNYGIFPDFFSANLMMDHFIKNQNFRDASKVASFVMLQEEFDSSSITKYLGLYSCLKFLENPDKDKWEPYTYPVEEVVKKGGKKEDNRQRVKDLRNPFFDDHFDLDEPRHIVGKTLVYISLQIIEDPVLKDSVELLGYTLWDKWDRVDSLLKNSEMDKKIFTKDTVEKIKTIIEERVKEMETSADKASLARIKVKPIPGMNHTDKEALEICYKKLNFPEFSKYVKSIQNSLTTIKFKLDETSLLKMSEDILSKIVQQKEPEEIKKQNSIYSDWTKLREERLVAQVRRVKDSKTLEDIEKKKKELVEKEETIFFFDNEEQWMMRVPPEEEKQKWIVLSPEYKRKLRMEAKLEKEGKGVVKKATFDADAEGYVPPKLK